ncbi:MAG: hypothetical protein LBJ23_04305 [Tannerella sp.]|jgi:hypothetical protein|nr:hypothetical protein [Tannerella sp.]
MSYIDLLKTEVEKEGFNFYDFINKLSPDALNAFTEDVISRRTENMRMAFPSSKNISTDDIVFQEMVKLPHATYQTVRDFLEQIFSNALAGVYSDNKAVIDRIIALTVLRKEGLRIGYITHLLDDPAVKDDIKTSLAVLFSTIDNSSCRLYLENRKSDIYKYPYLIPAYISAYKNVDPSKGLKILIGMDRRPDNFKYYNRPIITSLENLLIEKDNIPDYLSLYYDKDMPPWVKQEFETILSSSWFTKNEVKKKIDAYTYTYRKSTYLIIQMPSALYENRSLYQGQVRGQVSEIENQTA